MRKLLLTTLGISTSLLAITQEQQVKIDELFNQKEQNISQSTEFGAGEKQMLIQALKEEKARVEKMGNEEIEEYFDNEKRAELAKNDTFDPSIMRAKKSEEWVSWIFGASGARFSGFFGGNLGGAYMVFATIGPKYNVSYDGCYIGTAKGFSVSLPIGLGAINTSGVKNNDNFVLPIAVEVNYMLSDYMGFGVSAGLRYTYSPQNGRDLHLMDFYAGLDLIYGIYIEAGYVFYSSQDVKLGNRTYSTDPLSGAITFNLGWRF